MKDTPVIKSFTTSENFKYLWMKYVTGFDLNTHCARCLLGTYSRRIRADLKEGHDIVLNEAECDYYYICGVSSPYVWSNNLHLVFRYKKGSSVDYIFKGTRIVVEDAEIIEIKQQPCYDDIHADNPAYTTCRNWRFAYNVTHGLLDVKPAQ